MRVHVIRHVPFEGPGLIASWAEARGHELTSSFALTEEFPPPREVDLLVVMGGPMDADDEVASPWLTAEKRWIVEVISEGRLVIGVCLGAQILAELVGGAIRRNEHREIGWFPVTLTSAGASDPVFSAFPDQAVVGLWHGDTFSLPADIEPALSTPACRNQAFSAEGGRVVALQFHLEWAPNDVELLLEHCAGEIASGPYMQSAHELMQGARSYSGAAGEALYALLDRMEALGPREDEGQ